LITFASRKRALTTANPAAMNPIVATRLDFAPCAMPTIEWPLGQPLAQRAP
jgi:hypothetical protein